MMHPDRFDNLTIPVVISVMKFFVELYLVIMCIALVATSETPHETVMDFIALGVISNLDERYFESIKNPLKEKLIANNFAVPIEHRKKSKVSTKGRDCRFKFYWGLLNTVKMIYEVGYFHFAPYAVFLFETVVQNTISITGSLIQRDDSTEV